MSAEHERPRPTLAEVARRSLEELNRAVVPRAGPLPLPTPVPPARPKKPSTPALSDDCARLLEHVARHPEATIDERADALGMDRNAEGRARSFLLKAGFITRTGAIGKQPLFGLTEKGKDWARERGIPLLKEDTGTLHEALCRRSEGSFTRDVEGARSIRPGNISGVLPDRLLVLDDGLRIAIQVCDANTAAYEADRLARLAADRTVDGAVLVAATRAKAGMVRRTLAALVAGPTGDRAAGAPLPDAGLPAPAAADRPDPLGATAELRALVHRKVLITDAAAIEKRQFRWADLVARWRAAAKEARDAAS
ncbi:MAG: hypothetical protein HY369_03640 [Candidatus Aenigmarchaeota archaeon]|nr:hypothetical protein [Candidatus Aenigmarchaeota archaeon]